MQRVVLFAIVVAVIASAGSAAVKPASLFTDNAVLQQGIAVPVWGMADTGEKVTVKFQGQEVSAKAKDGKWMVRLTPLKAGGPFDMTIAGSNTIELKNILVGEVWVCSGQSNMAFALSRAANGSEAIAASKDPMLRLYTVPRKASYTAVSEVEGASWVACDPDTVPTFSGVAYFFGRDLRRALDVPVGLIHTSWGGTFAQAWMSPDGWKALPEYGQWVAAENAKQATGPNHPSVLYNAMINPLIPYAIKGAIWYQGESNAGRAYQYISLFPNMIESWRNAWKQGDFPFLFVQLAPFEGPARSLMAESWAELRESQLLTAKTCPNTGMAVITDAGDPVDIHPTRKEPVGARLALAARKIAYGQDIVHSGPIYKGMKKTGGSIRLYFDSIGSGLVAKDGALKGFTIAGADNVFVEATASILDGNKVIVSSPMVANPVSVRYGWSNCPDVNLFNAEGIPATPFRTDSLPMKTMP